MTQRLEILEIDVGYHLRRWGTTGTTGLYTHSFTEYDVAGVWINGTSYTLAASLAACGSTSGTKTYFNDVGTALYVHEHNNGDPNLSGTTVKVNVTWGFSRPGAVIPKSDGITVRPIFYDGRLQTVPSISYHSSPDVLGGGAVVAIGEATLLNSDGYFDSRAPKVIWDNQPARLYEGMQGGTLPADFTLRQACVTTTPTIDASTLTIALQADTDILKQNINRGDTLPQTLGYSPGRGQPAPVIFGPFAGIPIYFWEGPTGTGTYYVACHACGTVTAVRDGTGGTHPIHNNTLISGSPARVVVDDSYFGSFASQPLFADGTGYIDAGGTPMTAGSIFQFALASRGGIAATKLDTFAISQLDAERNVTLSTWLGRGETIEQCLDYVSRSAFADWTVGRDGKYTVQAIRNTPGSNPIPGGNFESGLPGGNGTPIENVSGFLTSRLSSAKMLIYNSLLFADTSGAAPMYRGGTLTSSPFTETIASVRMQGSSGTPNTSGSVALWVRFTGGTTGYSAYEAILGTHGTVTLNRVISGTVDTLVTQGFPFSGTRYYKYILDGTTTASGLTRMRVWVDALLLITFTTSNTAVPSGYGGIGIAANGTTVDIGTIGFTYGNETILESNWGSSTNWTNASSASHGGTQPGHFAFDGKILAYISKPSGTLGTLARIYQGGMGGTSGVDYVMSCVAALQSGTSGSFAIAYSDASGTEHRSVPLALGTGTYARVWHHFRPGSTGLGTVSIYPSYNATSMGTVWVDNLELYKVKTIHHWQNKGEIKADIKVPIYYQVSAAAVGELTGTESRIPPVPFEGDPDQRLTYYVSDPARTNAQYLYSGMEALEVNALTWSQHDARVLANAVQDYYSVPRASLEIEFLDWQGETINLWDVLYFPDGRIPGLPDDYRLFKVVEIEDQHPNDAPPRMWVRGEIPYNPTYDVMDV